MRRVAGWVLIIHAFAHSFAGMRSESVGSWSIVAWMLATVGYLFAGLGLLRMPGARRHWKFALLLATIASMHLFAWYRPPRMAAGVAIDLVVFIGIFAVWQQRIDDEIDWLDSAGAGALRHPRLAAGAWTLGGLLLAYVATVLATRPVMLRWGSTSDDRTASLPGDDVHPLEATRNASRPTAAAFFLAPVDVFVFEPAHFIMERGMLRGVRARAERSRS